MSWVKRINWITSLFLVLTPLAALVWGALRVWTVGVQASEVAWFAFFYAATAVSITAGYHRLFAHGSYDCHPLVKAFYALFGAASFQQSVLVWVADHRRHHQYVDREGDPYNIRRGFLWAHIGWLMVDVPPADLSNVRDLASDRMLVLQDRFYLPIAVGVSFGLQLAIGFLIGNPWGILLWAGLVRLVAAHHATFCVNSLAHTLGTRPYSRRHSARDSVVTALVTFGEGYHNFHHSFATDYRNGLRAYQWDPTKWLIRALASVGLAWNLYRVPRERVVRARLQVETERLLARVKSGSGHALEAVRERLGALARTVEDAAAHWGRIERQRSGGHTWEAKRRAPGPTPSRAELRTARREFQSVWKEWRTAVAELGHGGLLPDTLAVAAAGGAH